MARRLKRLEVELRSRSYHYQNVRGALSRLYMDLNWAFGDVYGPIEAHMWP